MRRFSDELVEDREFEIGGELFSWRYPHWEDGAAIFDQTLVPETNGDTSAFSFKADTELAISRIPPLLDPKNDAVKRFKALVARKTDPVPRHQLVELYRWLVQVSSGLPTSPPSEQASGGGETGTTSSAGSSSKAATSTT
jgi:hypothetical protein